MPLALGINLFSSDSLALVFCWWSTPELDVAGTLLPVAQVETVDEANYRRRKSARMVSLSCFCDVFL